MTRVLILSAIVMSGTAIVVARPHALTNQPAPSATVRYFKGNLHTHTLNSDGDSTPDDVVRWYREHGYNFVTLTDHNYLTSVDGLNALHGADDQFVVMRGEEVTDRFGTKPVHVNGFAVDRFIKPPGGRSLIEMYQQMIDAIRAANAVPSVNHPNFGWALTGDDLAQLQRTRLFEVFNGHPQVNNLGGGGVPGLEETWDRILSSGRLLYGIAVDDAHHFKRPEDRTASRPGQAWVYVRAPRLQERALVEALERGDFYASTGVELESVTSTPSSMTIAVKADSFSKYRIQFIGRDGVVLSEALASPATYRFTGQESYVRARVIESNGRLAWVQPVPVGAQGPK